MRDGLSSFGRVRKSCYFKWSKRSIDDRLIGTRRPSVETMLLGLSRGRSRTSSRNACYCGRAALVGSRRPSERARPPSSVASLARRADRHRLLWRRGALSAAAGRSARRDVHQSRRSVHAGPAAATERTTNLKIEKSAKPKVCEDTGADWK